VSFDVIYSRGTIEHFRDPERALNFLVVRSSAKDARELEERYLTLAGRSA